MARYKKTDDDAGSVSSIQLNEGVRSGGTGVSFIGWHQRSRLERVLLVLTASLALAVLLTTCLLLATGGPTYLPVPPCYQPEPKESSVCLSSSCIYTASEVIRALDETQNPCEDFYEFACGGWMRNNPIPEGKSQWGIFSKIELQNQLIIRSALEKVNVSDKNGGEFKARVYYDACIDTNETIEKLAEKPLVEVINKLGGWHLLDNSNNTNSSMNNNISNDTKDIIKDFDLQVLLQDVQNNVCLSSSCIYTASEVIRALDETQNPCEDFYEFACGGWMRNNPIPEGKSQWGIFSKIELQNQLIIRSALEKVNVSDKNGGEFKARVYYDACIDTNETIEKLAEKPLVEVINKLGGWHLLDNSNNTNSSMNNNISNDTKDIIKDFDLQVLLQDVQNKYNLPGLFNWAVTEDDRNSSTYIIVLDQGGLNLPTRDYYLNKKAYEKVIEAYLNYMTRVCVLLGANETKAKEQMRKVIQFETDLARITTPSEDRRDEEGLYNPFTLKQWQKEANFLNWTAFFNDAFQLVGRTISENEKIVVYAPEYFRNLTKVLKNYTKNNERKTILKNYLIWQVSRDLSTYLSKAFRDATKILRKALYGSEGTEESWRYCVTDTNNALGFAVGAMFVREVFHGEAKTQGELMIDNIRNAFKKNLRNLDWMDSETRKAAETKADAITDMIGFPDYILHKEELDKQYDGLVIEPNEYFENNIAFNLFSLKNDLKKLDQPVNRTKWGMTPSTVNAYYTPTKNQIVFPAGILQLPFYDGDNPKSVNYGAMGVVMGHELTHAFDDQGREYDRFGNLNQWWNNATINRFKKRAECIQKQYSNYSMEGQPLNGKQTLGENIADNGGLKASFHAYLDYSRTEAKVNFTLPGLKYNHRQLFFISFAQAWCSSMTKESTKMQIEKDDYTIAKYRIIGSISNLREFSNEFNCPIGSNMNPKHKCEVW